MFQLFFVYLHLLSILLAMSSRSASFSPRAGYGLFQNETTLALDPQHVLERLPCVLFSCEMGGLGSVYFCVPVTDEFSTATKGAIR